MDMRTDMYSEFGNMAHRHPKVAYSLFSSIVSQCESTEDIDMFVSLGTAGLESTITSAPMTALGFFSKIEEMSFDRFWNASPEDYPAAKQTFVGILTLGDKLVDKFIDNQEYKTAAAIGENITSRRSLMDLKQA